MRMNVEFAETSVCDDADMYGVVIHFCEELNKVPRIMEDVLQPITPGEWKTVV